MKKVIRISYSYIAVPVLFILTLFATIVNVKVRKAVQERFKISNKIKEYLANTPSIQKRIIIHCASMGEFEHIKPLISKLSAKKNVSIIITFFSPSGYEYVKDFDGVDLIIYTPFDFALSWKKLLLQIKPKMLLISKHDAWPNQVWISKDLNIPVFLVNASLSENSSRITGIAGFLYKYIYPEFDSIYCISNGDKKRFEKYFPGTCTIKTGDTKFDQVRLRKERAKQRHLIPQDWLKGKLILILGSIWPEDFNIFKSSLNQLLIEFKNLNLIVVPHQPGTDFLNMIKKEFSETGVTLFSDNIYMPNTRVLLVDRIGILADLYKYGHMAYVGGSFKQGIHNVMEPAIYGMPVFYGPIHKNSYDAVKLLEHNGSKVLNNKNDVIVELRALIQNQDLKNMLGKNALDFAIKHTGTTDKLLKIWNPYLE